MTTFPVGGLETNPQYLQCTPVNDVTIIMELTKGTIN